MLGMRGSMGLGKRIVEIFPKGLVFSLNENLAPGSSNYVVTLPSNIPSSTSVTFAVAFVPPPTSGDKDLLNNNDRDGFGEIPRLVQYPNGTTIFYYVGKSPFFDNGLQWDPGVLVFGATNIFVATINGTVLDGWLNGVRANARFATGTARTEEWITSRTYRLSGLPYNTNLFDGTYNYFGIWRRSLNESEVNTLYSILKKTV